MFKKFISVILAVILSVSYCVAASAEYSGSEKDIADGYITGVPVSDGGLMKIVYYDENGNELDMNDFSGSMQEDSLVKKEYPKTYDARDYGLVTSVKNQSPFGTCWAFATCAAAETSLIKQGYETKDSIDLSEAHLAYFSNHSGIDNPESETDKDVFTTSDPFGAGSYILVNASLGRGSGFALEKDFPYSQNAEDMHFKDSDKYESKYQLTYSQTYVYDFNIDAVKESILKYGSAAMSFYAIKDKLTYRQSDDGFCYYNPVEMNSNHEVTVIGWDDSFSASNFPTDPGADGAWLIKNSWGTDWGDGGYCWMSYYDAGIDEYTVLTAAPAGSYSKIYQYDGTVCLGTLTCHESISSMANIFTAENDGESVAAASFTLELSSENYTADVSLYTNLADSSNPSSGTLCETKSIPCGYGGYYLVNFNGTYPVEKGEKFAVVVTIHSSENVIYLPVESVYNKFEDKLLSLKGMSLTHFSQEGQSFIKIGDNEWEDVFKSGYNNFPVKALTVSDSDIASLEINTLPQKTEYFTGNTLSTEGLSLIAKLNSGEEKIISGGFSCDTDKLTSAGTKTVTVTYSGKSVSFPVTVNEMPDDAVTGIKTENITVNAKQSGAIPVSVQAGGDSDYTAEYYSNSKNIVSLDEDGNYYALKRGSADIICTVTDEYGNTFTDTCTVTVRYTFGQWLIIIFLFGWIWYV